MQTRRQLLLATSAITLGTGCIGFSNEPNANIQWGNFTNETLSTETIIRTTESFLSTPETVYRIEMDIPPTEGNRVVETDAVATREYVVLFTIESESGNTRQEATYTWTPSGCNSQNLIINVSPEYEVEFLQDKC